jgi:DNA-binding MarR family transcriptional regulator
VTVLENRPDERLAETGGRAGWTFLTNHAHVLLCIARDPSTRLRDVADVVRITERAAQSIVADLVLEGYLVRTKVGRRNQYEINENARLRHPTTSAVTVGELLDLLRGTMDPSLARVS